MGKKQTSGKNSHAYATYPGSLKVGNYYQWPCSVCKQLMSSSKKRKQKGIVCIQCKSKEKATSFQNNSAIFSASPPSLSKFNDYLVFSLLLYCIAYGTKRENKKTSEHIQPMSDHAFEPQHLHSGAAKYIQSQLILNLIVSLKLAVINNNFATFFEFFINLNFFKVFESNC